VVRVLWIGHNLAYPPVRGVLLRNYNLLRQAANRSELHFLGFDQPRSRPAGVTAQDCAGALGKFCAGVEWLPLPSGIRKSRYFLGLQGLVSRRAYDLNWLASDAMAQQLRHTLEAREFDVVHFDTLGLAQYRPLVGKSGAVLNHHNVESAMMDHRADVETRRIATRYWRGEARKLRLAEQRYCPQFASNLVVSHEDGELLTGIAPGVMTRVVANGVDTEYFTPRPDPGGKTLLFCGGLDWYPNGEAMEYFFREIWPLLVQRVPDVRVIVVGRNPPRWLEKLSAEERRVEVTGFVDEARKYFREATAYFCPIRMGGGTRLKILDALAMGMPLVGTTFACSGIAMRHGEHALMADTPAGFVDELVRVLADPQLRADLAARGRQLVCDRYSWSVVGHDLISAYEEAAADSAQSPVPRQ
jgi:glycosyltransferase involved in cell wall biosynthesis